MSNDKKFFPKGLWFNEPHERAPEFVKGQVSIKVEEFRNYLSKVNGEYLNIDLKISKDGKPYAEVNTFKPDKSKPANEPEIPDDFHDDLDSGMPF